MVDGIDPAEFIFQQMEKIIGRLLDKKMGILSQVAKTDITLELPKHKCPIGDVEVRRNEIERLVAVELRGEIISILLAPQLPTTGKKKKKNKKGKMEKKQGKTGGGLSPLLMSPPPEIGGKKPNSLSQCLLLHMEKRHGRERLGEDRGKAARGRKGSRKVGRRVEWHN